MAEDTISGVSFITRSGPRILPWGTPQTTGPKE